MVVSRRWVPTGTGTPIVLYELFRHFPADSVRVVCGPGLQPRTSSTLPFPTTRLTLEPIDRLLSGGYRKLGAHALPLLRTAMEALVRWHRPPTIYAHFPDAVFVTAAALTAEKFGIPLVTYFDILWEGNDESGLGPAYEHRVVKIAQRRFAITERYCEHLSSKHGVPFELMPHVIVPPSPRPQVVPREQRRPIVHLGGNVYANMNLDCVQTMHRVLEAMDQPPELEILGFTPAADLERWGINGPFVRTGTVTRAELLERQRSCQVLYLPEAFDTAVPEMILNNFPTKALEYMLTGTPILVHAPADCYLTRVAREHGWAVIVDQPGEAPLRAGLARIMAGGADIDAMADRGWQFACSRDGRQWNKVLQAALGVAGSAS
jgi:glycosyltransferase involved in cell wall biosynthesis